jgi:hypothetical protein
MLDIGRVEDAGCGLRDDDLVADRRDGGMSCASIALREEEARDPVVEADVAAVLRQRLDDGLHHLDAGLPRRGLKADLVRDEDVLDPSMYWRFFASGVPSCRARAACSGLHSAFCMSIDRNAVCRARSAARDPLAAPARPGCKAWDGSFSAAPVRRRHVGFGTGLMGDNNIKAAVEAMLPSLTVSEKRAAMVLLAGYPMVGLDPITGFAKTAKVSTATIQRLMTASSTPSARKARAHPQAID